jgi:endonuclease/exonuclease/phosphatase family metal-dependent hydrolase/peptidoglycan hydrolase-like protein with peptidoglycan-binding domain
MKYQRMYTYLFAFVISSLLCVNFTFACESIDKFCANKIFTSIHTLSQGQILQHPDNYQEELLGNVKTIFLPTLYVGATGQSVVELQTKLVSLGYLTSDNITGYFGLATEAAVKQFQKANNLESVGYVGPRTKELLQNSVPQTSVSPVYTTSERQALITKLINRISELRKELEKLKKEKGGTATKDRSGSQGSTGGSHTPDRDTSPSNNVRYEWSVGVWGRCGLDATQTRTVVCRDTTQSIVADRFCSGLKPKVAQSCEPPQTTKARCLFNKFRGTYLQHGEQTVAYKALVVPVGQQCMSETRTCNDGALSGSYIYSVCKVQGATTTAPVTPLKLTLTPAGGDFEDSQVITITANTAVSIRYTINNTAPTCTSGLVYRGPVTITETRTVKAVGCLSDGTASSVYTQQYTRKPNSAKNCSINGKSVSHGSSVKMYEKNLVTYGQSCKSENRTCNNGVLSGSYVHELCQRQLKVMTYNIHAGKGTDGLIDINRIATLIKNSKADIVGLQEVDSLTNRSGRLDMPTKLAELTGMHMRYGSNMDYDGGMFGNVVLSKYPIVSSINTLLPRVLPNEQRGVQQVVINTGESNVLFMNTHLAYVNDSTERLQSIAKIKDLIESSSQKKAVIVGDFNAKPNSDTLIAASVFLRDAWAAGSGNGYTVPVGIPTKRIDYIMYSQTGFSANSASVLSSNPTYSDHLPVIADIVVK